MERLKITVAPKNKKWKIGGSSETDATPVDGNVSPSEGMEGTEISMLRSYQDTIVNNNIKIIQQNYEN